MTKKDYSTIKLIATVTDYTTKLISLTSTQTIDKFITNTKTVDKFVTFTNTQNEFITLTSTKLVEIMPTQLPLNVEPDYTANPVVMNPKPTLNKPNPSKVKPRPINFARPPPKTA